MGYGLLKDKAGALAEAYISIISQVYHGPPIGGIDMARKQRDHSAARTDGGAGHNTEQRQMIRRIIAESDNG